MTERALATIREVKEIREIKGADRIVCAVIDGWELVTQKSNGFKPGDLVIYFEIDSLLPEIPQFEWLRPYYVTSKNSINGNGFRLKTIKLRGQISQGLILPIAELPVLSDYAYSYTDGKVYQVGDAQYGHGPEVGVGHDLTDALHVQKWERPIPANLAGQVRGTFPSFMKKTDQERIQNCFSDWHNNWREEEFEVTLKLDGSSFTAYYLQASETNPVARFGVCSRNMDLMETEGNAFWQVARKLNLEEKLSKFPHSVGIQGELMGPGVQGNREKLDQLDMYAFDMFNIDTFKYLYSVERVNWCGFNGVKHVPIIDLASKFSGFMSAKDFLQYAERPSMNADQAEGVVFKSIKFPCYSFKAISNAYLLGDGE